MKIYKPKYSAISDYGWELVCGTREEGWRGGGSSLYNVQNNLEEVI